MLIIILTIIFNKYTCLTGKDRGAYLKTPDPNELQYRLGNGIGYIGNGWDDSKMYILSSMCGYDGQRKKLPEQHFINWGYEIEVGDCKTNDKYGILDVVGYLATPSKEHSSNKTENSELCYPANLYEPIWLEDGSVNPNNYWAFYINKTVTIYKDYIKIWETWNEPDYTQNYNDVSKWKTEPPEPKILTHWYGTIFEYIRLLRITYEVAKKVDPTCWVATGGLGYTNFLDAILRYTDNPDGGKVTEEYPAYGGAYFDCDAYHQYPQWGVTDEETGEGYNDNGSDILAKKVVILKKSHHFIIKKYGFGSSYPDKLFINTETGVNSASGNGVGGELVRRNWIIKLALYCIEYDVRQHHMLILADGGGGSGDYEKLEKFVSIEEGYKHLKSSSKPRIILKKMNIGKFIFDEEKTKKLRNNLPNTTTGIVLKRKFPKKENETYYYKYIYSMWVFCQKEEVDAKILIELNKYLPFDPLIIDYEGNEKREKKDSNITLTNTPIFFLGDFDDSSNEPSDDSSSDSNKDSSSNSSEQQNNSILIIGIAVGAAVLLIISIIVVVCIVKKCKSNKEDDEIEGGLLNN